MSNMRTGSPKRELSLDVIRGIAVIAMVLTHAIAFFYNGSDPLVQNIGIIGGLISFTIFLFVSGAAGYISYVRYDGKTESESIKHRRKQIISRSIGMLIGYYVVATVASIPSYSFPPNISWLENIARTLFLSNVPEFTEFIVAFVIFSLALIPLRRFYKFSLKFPPLLILAGIGLYIVGQALNPLVLNDSALFLKSLFVGHTDWHRFPFFQYFIVYAFGLIWGKFLINHPGFKTRLRINLFTLGAFAMLSVSAIVSSQYFDSGLLQPLNRFPPSATFLLLGLTVTYFIFLVVNATDQLKMLGFGQVFIHYLGAKSFNLFVFHTILLFIYKFTTDDHRIDSTIILFVMFGGLLIAASILSIVKDWIIDNLKEEAGVTEGFGWLFSEKFLVFFIWTLIIFLGGLAIYQGGRVEAAVNPDDVLFKKKLIREQDWPFWWDHNYNYFRQITISADSGLPIFRNNWYGVNFDHGTAVKQSQSLPNAADVRIVYYNEESGFIEIPIIIDGIGGNATVKFKLQDDILPGQPDDKYFIYYGNQTSNSYPASKETPASIITAGVSQSDVYKHRLNGQTNRRWIVKEGSAVSLQQRTLLYTVQLDSTLAPDSLVSYSVQGTDLRGLMDNLGGGKFQASIRVTDVKPGVYQIQAVAREKENKLKLVNSGFSTFYVTYPLYVVWTQDWEGWDVPDSWLAEIDAFAKKHDMPMTHFFNPRIYATSAVSKARADAMSLWVLKRARENQDEIGLHLHMWFDMVRAAGVTPRYTDSAPWLYGDGGGVAAYTYPVEEMKQILNWSRRVFQDNGLPTPISFRAGGWLAKANTLQALEQTGFLIDSSGRTAVGDNFTRKMVTTPPPWTLTPTTRPYRPNVTDINSSASPQMNIWQFPNNGADSIWYNETEMIRRFDMNYPNKGQILTEPQVVNYLSHPPFWTIDRPRVTVLFNYIDNYLYKKDLGPVIYSTLENVYYSWDRTK